jgi:hypothetical protein
MWLMSYMLLLQGQCRMQADSRLAAAGRQAGKRAGRRAGAHRPVEGAAVAGDVRLVQDLSPAHICGQGRQEGKDVWGLWRLTNVA